MVVVVSNATTLFEIANKHRISIQNYLIEKNRDASTQALRMRFVLSAAVSCVLSHVVGVGDRHLDNLMVTDDGCLFNIDFGYIFGSEVLHRRVSENSMKITPEILDRWAGKQRLLRAVQGEHDVPVQPDAGEREVLLLHLRASSYARS